METPHLPTFKSHTLPTPSSLTFLLPRPSPPACWGSNLCRSFLSFLITDFPLCNHLPSCKQTNKQKPLTSLILYPLPLFYPHSWQKFCSLFPSFHICSSSQSAASFSTSWSHWQGIPGPLCCCRRLPRAGSRAVPSSAGFCELTLPASSIPSAQHQILSLLSGRVLGWPKGSFRLFHMIIWKNPNKTFGRLSTYKISTSSPDPLLSTAALRDKIMLKLHQGLSTLLQGTSKLLAVDWPSPPSAPSRSTLTSCSCLPAPMAPGRSVSRQAPSCPRVLHTPLLPTSLWSRALHSQALLTFRPQLRHDLCTPHPQNLSPPFSSTLTSWLVISFFLS